MPTDPMQHAESVAVTLTSLESIDVETAIEFYEAAVSKVHATLGLHGDIDDESPQSADQGSLQDPGRTQRRIKVTDQQFTALLERFDSLEAKLGRIAQSVGQLDTRVTDLQQRFALMTVTLDEVRYLGRRLKMLD